MRRSTSLWRLAEDAERLGRGDDRERVMVVAQHAPLQLFGGILDPAVLFLLMEVGLHHRRSTRAVSGALRGGRPGASVLSSRSLRSSRSSCASVLKVDLFSSP